MTGFVLQGHICIMYHAYSMVYCSTLDNYVNTMLITHYHQNISKYNVISPLYCYICIPFGHIKNHEPVFEACAIAF